MMDINLNQATLAANPVEELDWKEGGRGEREGGRGGREGRKERRGEGRRGVPGWRHQTRI